MNDARLNIVLPEELKKRAIAEAKKQNLSFSTLIRQGIEIKLSLIEMQQQALKNELLQKSFDSNTHEIVVGRIVKRKKAKK